MISVGNYLGDHGHQHNCANQEAEASEILVSNNAFHTFWNPIKI